MPARSSKKPSPHKELPFDLIITHLTDAIVLLDAEGRKLFATPALATILGYTVNELENWHFFEHIHPEDLAALKEWFTALQNQQTGKTLHLYRQQHKQGHYIWLETKIDKLLPPASPTIQYLASIRNVSQRIITEQMDWFRYNLIKTAFHLLPCSIIIVSIENKLIHTNKYTLDLFGLPDGKPSPENLYDLFPEDAERIAKDNALVWQSGQELVKEDVLRTKKKIYIVQLGRKLIRPLPQEEKLLLIQVIDITERKIVEKEIETSRNFIRNIVFAIPDIVYVYDLEEKKYVFSNNGFEKILGYTTSQMEEMSDPVHTLLHPEDAPALSDLLAEIARGEKDYFEYSYRLQDAFGNYQWFHCRKMAFKRNSAGNITQLLGLVQDFHLRWQVEEDRKNAQHPNEAAQAFAVQSADFSFFDHLFLKTPGEYINFLQTYINEFAGYHQHFRQCVVDKDYILFRKTRHKINPAIHHLKAEALKQLLLAVENYLTGNLPEVSTVTLLRELNLIFDKITAEIAGKIKSLP